MSARKIRTTVGLSADLLEAVDSAIREGKVDSRNDFLDMALRNELSARRRADIDAAFAHMATDRAYRQEAVDITDEFEALDLLG